MKAWWWWTNPIKEGCEAAPPHTCFQFLHHISEGLPQSGMAAFHLQGLGASFYLPKMLFPWMGPVGWTIEPGHSPSPYCQVEIVRSLQIETGPLIHAALCIVGAV